MNKGALLTIFMTLAGTLFAGTSFADPDSEWLDRSTAPGVPQAMRYVSH